MQPFLEKAAEYICNKHTLGKLSQLCVVLPSRRGVFFFKQALAKQALAKQANKPFFTPDVWAIDDFVSHTTGLREIDPMSLLFELYDVFKEIDPEVKFDRFMTWASILLGDFDRIDLYLADAKALFSWMTEAKAIERWNVDRPLYTKPTKHTDRFFKLYENIYTVYQNLKQRLNDKRLVYRGMAYRQLAEELQQKQFDKVTHEKYYFVGFNALSISEEEIFRILYDTNRAEMLWDTDDFYMESKDQEAGQWLRSYKNYKDEKGVDKNYFGGTNNWNWQSDELIKGHKNFQVIGVPNASMQSKVAGHIYGKWKMEVDILKPSTSNFQDPSSDFTPTAIVLGDENLLVPLMNSLDVPQDTFNITMGLSLKNSMLFTLIDALFELQRNLVEFKTKEGEKIKIPKFSHRHIVKILNHPYVRRYELVTYIEVNPIRQTLQTITNQNRVFLDTEELFEMGENEPLFKILFTRWDASPKKAMACFYQLIDILREIYKPTPEAIETEYIYQFYLILQRLESIIEERGQGVQLRSFKTFLFELIKQNKIPFSGERITPLQIMGMLETRTLDFERLIIMSVNEGTLPAGKKQNSLIPFDACIEFGLPTHSQQDAVMAYHFYRLLQRAKEVVMLHVLPSDTYGGGEKSRFLLQIEHELAYINKNISLSYPKVVFQAKEKEKSKDELKIEKTPDILAFIENDITTKGIFPSHLNQFMACGLQYYFNRVAGIQEAEEVEDTLAADRFGNWIHRTFENIDKEFLAKDQRNIQAEDLQKIIDNLPHYLEIAFKETNRGLQHQSGLNYIFYQVGKKIVQDFLNYQIDHEPFPLQLLDAEKKLMVIFETEIQGKTIPLKIAGRIDRLDRVNEHEIRVIDYKTGKVEQKDLLKAKDQSTIEALNDKEKDKYRQLWLYKYMVLKLMSTGNGLNIKGVRLLAEQHQVSAGIYSFRNIQGGFLKQNVSFEENETVEDFLKASEIQLNKFANQLLDPTQPFEKTDDLTTCERCTYRRICGR